MAHIRQTRPDYGLGLRHLWYQGLQIIRGVLSLLDSGLEIRSVMLGFRKRMADVVWEGHPTSQRLQQEISGEVQRGEKMLYSGTDTKSYVVEFTSVHED